MAAYSVAARLGSIAKPWMSRLGRPAGRTGLQVRPPSVLLAKTLCPAVQTVCAVGRGSDAGLQRARLARCFDHKRFQQEPLQGRHRQALQVRNVHLRAHVGQREAELAAHLASLHVELAVRDGRLVCERDRRKEKREGEGFSAQAAGHPRGAGCCRRRGPGRAY